MAISTLYLEEIMNLNPDLDEGRVRKALNFATLAHEGQKRFSGEPFVTHPVETAKLLASWHMDTTSVVAGLLHDSIEKGAATKEDIQTEFGSEVAFLVEGVTKLDPLTLGKVLEDANLENLRRLFIAMAKDIRVVVIRIAERLHNMRTLDTLPAERRERYANDSLEIYAALAGRLGMGVVKAELEDLAFKYLYPEDYEWLVKYSEEDYRNLGEDLGEVKKTIEDALTKERVKAKIFTRKKHLYSLYRKLLRPEINRDITRVHDLAAMRVITETVADCYAVQGIITTEYQLASELKMIDFIASPKPNGYRSIHLKIVAPSGRFIEVQIRTWQMHEEAEYGVASHFYYSALKTKGVADEKLESGRIGAAPVSKLAWIKNLVDWQKNITDNFEFKEGLQTDFLSERILVFTPNGDLKDLPAESTPVDFAYSVHSDLGQRILGAKVNGKIVGLDFKLKSGDVCEILLTKEKRKPSPDWLEFVRTRHAKKEISKFVRGGKS